MSSAASSSQNGSAQEEVTAQELVATRNAVAQVSTGRAVNQDSWMSVWCSSNWGELLQPAPLSISLLGSILILASTTNDFSLVTDRPGGTQRQWKYATHPDSFKTCLQQMVGDGYIAFETAHKNMERIHNLSSQMPEVIQTCVNLALIGTPAEFRSHFQNSVQDLAELVQKCEQAAKATEFAFQNLSGLAQEMVEACTYKAGSTEQALVENEESIAVLAMQEAHEKAAADAMKASAKMAKKMYENAEEDFRTAIKAMPGGWGLTGMNTVESLVGVVSGAGNAVVSIATEAANVPISWFRKGAPVTRGMSPKAVPTPAPQAAQPSPRPDALSDPAVFQAPRVLAYVNDIKAILTGNNGKPDWDRICQKRPKYTTQPAPPPSPTSPKSGFFSKFKKPSNKGAPAPAAAGPEPQQEEDNIGVNYVRSSLLLIRSRYIQRGKPFSMQLDGFIDTAVHILDRIIEVGRSVRAGDDKALKDKVSEADQLIAGVQCLVVSCNLMLQQSGPPSTGPATPAVPPEMSSGQRRVAVEDAKFKVAQTRIMLESRRTEFERHSERMIQQQESLLRTISEMTKLSLTNKGLRDVLPVLKEAVASFTTLRARFSQLSRFFEGVASLLGDVMVPSVDRWVKTLTANERDNIAGITIGAFTRDLIYRQMMTPLKISMLAERIAGTYVDVSTKFIMPAQMQVGSLMQFSDGKEDREAMMGRLRLSQLKLERDTKEASRQIAMLVAADQKSFTASIDTRLQTILRTVSATAPALAAPLPAEPQRIAEVHIQETDAARAEEASANPIFNPSLAM